MTSRITETNPAISSFPTESFVNGFFRRHLGHAQLQWDQMLAQVEAPDLATLIQEAVPEGILSQSLLELPQPIEEGLVLEELSALAGRNEVWKSYLGYGYSDTRTPAVIQRVILENPGWYTQYTPYQAEIAQGRLEALLNFQTLFSELTGLPVANASLLDEATAAAEAMTMVHSQQSRKQRHRFLCASTLHPQTLAVLQTRAEPQGIVLEHLTETHMEELPSDLAGVILQYPDTHGVIHDYRSLAEKVHTAGGYVLAGCDPMALVLLQPPSAWGADVAFGNSQRFGVPLGFGGPHAAFFAATEAFRRLLPGRLVGVSRDAQGRPALRLALQTREQHIRRDKATSNICTAQVLLAVIASMYAVYHGPDGLRSIARTIHCRALDLGESLLQKGYTVRSGPLFDTIRVVPGDVEALRGNAEKAKINLRYLPCGDVLIAVDEATSPADMEALKALFPVRTETMTMTSAWREEAALPAWARREEAFLTQEVFSKYQTETEFLRYAKRLESRDLSLTHSMIPLGSCTMKLNAAVEMLPVTWPSFSKLHPFVPGAQAKGYREMIRNLELWLAEITGLSAVSLQPNAGSQGEYAGLLAIRGWHSSRGESHRNICLIPLSAHGTNPASAVMAGYRVVPISCRENGDIDLEDLTAKAETHASNLAALMITYPSTHGVFESSIKEVCEVVHRFGGQVYMDGANMNAQVGLTSPGRIGADVCHLNLHKTFCIPHGGGGPGVGPIAVASHLAPFLPGHPLDPFSELSEDGAVSGAPYGSPSILVIPWVYIRLMGAHGLRLATAVAILNANYMVARLEGEYPILYRGERGRVAHEFIVDFRWCKEAAGVEVEDVAKRLMDYGYHAPTMSWPVAGTMMIEPTESESRSEMDRFCDALLQIREEIRQIEAGVWPRDRNPLKNAPHTMDVLASETWPEPYSRETAAFPLPWVKERKFWPWVGRVDNVYGDRNLVCTCPSVEEMAILTTA